MTTKEKLEELFDDNENYIHSYTGTPMIDTEKILPKILTLMQSNDIRQPNGSKPHVRGSLPLRQKAINFIEDLCTDAQMNRKNLIFSEDNLVNWLVAFAESLRQ